MCTSASGFLASSLIKRSDSFYPAIMWYPLLEILVCLFSSSLYAYGTCYFTYPILWFKFVGNDTKVAHLWNLQGAKERLRLVKIELTEDGRFDNAIMGYDGGELINLSWWATKTELISFLTIPVSFFFLFFFFLGGFFILFDSAYILRGQIFRLILRFMGTTLIIS